MCLRIVLAPHVRCKTHSRCTLRNCTCIAHQIISKHQSAIDRLAIELNCITIMYCISEWSVRCACECLCDESKAALAPTFNQCPTALLAYESCNGYCLKIDCAPANAPDPSVNLKWTREEGAGTKCVNLQLHPRLNRHNILMVAFAMTQRRRTRHSHGICMQQCHGQMHSAIDGDFLILVRFSSTRTCALIKNLNPRHQSPTAAKRNDE